MCGSTSGGERKSGPGRQPGLLTSFGSVVRDDNTDHRHGLGKEDIWKFSEEHCKKKNRPGWFCTHCNLTFDNPSICNLHTLAHAAENHEEAEIIVGLPNDLESVFTKVSKKGPEYRCPNCTKRVESSGCSDYSECDVSKVLLDSSNVDLTCSSLSHGIKSEDSNTTCNLNAQSTLVSSRKVNNSEEYLSQNLNEDSQLNSVFNSFRMRDLVIDDHVNNKTQSLNESNEIHSSEKQKEAVGVREMTLAVQQQHNELVHQSLLSSPLSESVARLSPPLLSDDKISVVDPSLESVAGYSILMDSPCVSNVIGNKNSENSSVEESGSMCPDFILSCVKCKQESTDLESSTNNSCEMESGIKLMSNIENSNSFDSGCFSAHFQSLEEKSSLSLALSSLPVSYLNISKLPHHKNEEPAYGVFARKTIPKRTQFGPIEGGLVEEIIRDKSEPPLQRYQDGKNLALLVESQLGTFQKLDVSQGKTTCWMQYVRPAQSFKEQNMILSQRGQSLFFTTTKIINPKQELKVWYSLPYANRRNLPLLQADVYLKKSVEGLEKIWPCFECNEKFVCSEGLQIHLNIHDLERDDGDSVDKNRAKRGNCSFHRKGVHFPRKYKCASEKHSEVFPYQCNTCHRAFPRNYNLKRHQLLHAKDKKYLCDVGGFQFTHLYNRDRHTYKRHKDNGNGSSKSLATFLKKKLTFKSSTLKANDGFEWFCVQCSLTFDSLQMLNLHSLSHGGFILDSEGLQCPQCLQEFESKKKLVEHVADHGKVVSQRRLRGSLNPAKPWKCELCYKSFATEDRLQRHMLVHGAEESKPLQCDICYKRFLNNSALACHIKIHTAEKKMFECPICKIVFEQVLSLKEHVHSHSVNGLYTCPQCNKVFDGYSLIRKHIRAFHSDRKHTCNYCGKLFPKLDKLRMHMLRHSDHREFLCANCGKQFKRKDKLKEHMKRMHSVERELRLAMKPHRPPATKKFMPKVSPTDYHRFIYKCHTCLLGFKRRGMLVNHLAKRHPDISPESVPELNLPILKTTRDYYCQYCEKVYKSSSKRKAHILKIHPGAELPMSNRRKGGVPEIPGLPNPTFSQTVGSITTHPHACPWCHKQYASKAKLLQHQRKKHIDLLPQSQQLTNVDDQESCSPDQQLILPHILQSTQQQNECPLTQLQGIENVINIIPGDYISSTDEELREFQESGIIIDTSCIERPVKILPDGISADLLSQAMSELTNEFRVTVGTSPNDHYLRIVQTSPGHITVTQTSGDLDNQDKDVLACATVNAVIGDPVTLSPSSVAHQTSTNLHQLLSESYSLPSSPSQSPSPQTWSNAHVTYTPFTAR